MTPLAPLHTQLQTIRAQRRGARWLRAGATLGIGVLGALAVLFVIDWLFALSVVERLILFTLAFGATGYLFVNQVWPWLARRESEIDVALLIERNSQIDSDLVAALQLESPTSRYGSSAQLADAVVARGASLGQTVDWQHVAHETAHRRALKWFYALALIAVLLAVVYPRHLVVFANRLLLGNRHYPSQTFIAAVQVGTSFVELGQISPAPIRAPYGQPLLFKVDAQGVLPERGEVRLSTVEASAPVNVELTPLADQPGVFVGQFPRLIENVQLQVFLGDDWTEQQTVLAIPLPVINLQVTAEPPEYARGTIAESSADGGPRQLAVIEGSRVAVGIECRNKPLKSAQLTIAGQSYPLQPLDETKKLWQLSSDNTPLANVREGLRYTLDVVDVDGLTLPEPLDGLLRIKTDRPPRVTAAIVTQHVLPTGKPRIVYGAVDDFGVAGLRLLYQVSRESGAVVEESHELPLDGIKPLVQGRYSFDLAPLQLNKGDQVRITLEARDHRGDNPGKVAVSDSLVLTVTDERGVLAAMTETDERTARQMDLIIQRQLGLGEGP
ncbi:MAG: hypothetical protein JNM18_07450 [Planctomycetaceae bacterium]|nr:hypothetical protein [Planctomycetaceae bacterium]